MNKKIRLLGWCSAAIIVVAGLWWGSHSRSKSPVSPCSTPAPEVAPNPPRTASPTTSRPDNPPTPKVRDYTAEQRARLDQVDKAIADAAKEIAALRQERVGVKVALVRNRPELGRKVTEMQSIRADFQSRLLSAPDHVKLAGELETLLQLQQKHHADMAALKEHTGQHGRPGPDGAAPAPVPGCAECQKDFDKLVARDVELGRTYGARWEEMTAMAGTMARAVSEKRSALIACDAAFRAQPESKTLLDTERARQAEIDRAVASDPAVVAAEAALSRALDRQHELIQQRIAIVRAAPVKAVPVRNDGNQTGQ